MTNTYKGIVSVWDLDIEVGEQVELRMNGTDDTVKVLVESIQAVNVIHDSSIEVTVKGELIEGDASSEIYEPKNPVDLMAYQIFESTKQLARESNSSLSLLGKAVQYKDTFAPIETDFKLATHVTQVDDTYLLLLKLDDDVCVITGGGNVDNGDVVATAKSDIEDFPTLTTATALTAVHDTHEQLYKYFSENPMRVMNYTSEAAMGMQKNIDNGHVSEDEMIYMMQKSMQEGEE